ncbi:MAG: hypothetical protein AAGH74_06260 [Pseudomonadota bacterium]
MTRWRGLAGVLAALLLPSPAPAGEFCAALEAFIAQAEPFADATQCATALGETGPSPYCFWRYELRAPEAQRAFDMLLSQIQTCVGLEAPQADQDVNHPDTYTARLFQTDQANLSLSLKDKSTLGETLIFLRASPRAE